MTEILPLIYFSHADLKTKENLNVSLEIIKPDLDISKFKSAFDANKNARKKIKLNITDTDMNYEAVEEDDQPYVVGILDKSDNSISVCQTPYFIMKPECYLGTNQSESTSNLSINQNSTYSEKLDSLTAAFGSSKKRKAMQTKLKNRIDTETLETAVNTAVEESKKNMNGVNHDEDEAGDNEASVEQFSILPVPNTNATTPAEVYNVNEILSLSTAEFDRYTAELSTKFGTATIEMINKWKTTQIYSEYICNNLLRLSGSKSNHQYRILKCKQLAYMNYLTVLYRLKAAQLRSKTSLNSLEVPDQIINKLFELYTVLTATNAQSRNVRSMPRRLKDKLTCHILILALHIDDFATELEAFQKDLKLSIQRLSDFFQALGCYIKSHVITVNDKKLVCKKATLSLPLNEIKKDNSKKRSRSS